MYVGITRAQRSLTVTWCRQRKRARDSRPCQPSRFIAEMQLDQVEAVPADAESMTPQNRLANLKALLQKPKAA
jgi:ATP-dependent DNA helicase Rep